MLLARSLFGFGVAFRVVALVSVLSSVLLAAPTPVPYVQVPKTPRALDRFEPDDTQAQAKVIKSGETQGKRSLDIVGDVDWVRFTVPHPSLVSIGAACVRGTLRLSLQGPTGGKVVVTEWTVKAGESEKASIPEMANLPAVVKNLTHLQETVKALSLDAGDYYMKVSNDARSGTIPEYSLSLAIADVPGTVQPGQVPIRPADRVPVQLPVATPTFSPVPPQTFTTPMTVGISSATAGASIRYTTNGADPTSTSPVYTEPLTLKATTTLKVRAFKSGMTDSAIASGVYTMLQQVATPTFSPPSGPLAYSVPVSISCATLGATIRFTTDGKDPTAKSPTYGSLLMFSSTTTLKAKAFKVGMTDSEVATAIYTKGQSVQVATPAQTAVTLTLYVHDGSATRPVLDGARVVGQDGAGNAFDQTTNASGCVALTGVPGMWQFTASKSGYQPSTWSQATSAPTTRHAFLQPVLQNAASPTVSSAPPEKAPTSNGESYNHEPHPKNAFNFNPDLVGFCTWYAADRWLWDGNSQLPSIRDAAKWPEDALGKGLVVGTVPVKGSVVVFGPTKKNSAGHVAYVESVDQTTFTISQMNAGKTFVSGLKTELFNRVTQDTLHIGQTEYKNMSILGFIYPSSGRAPR
jgi:surface antigen